MRRFRRQRRRPAATTDSRVPELRLEAMAHESNEDRRLRMFDRICSDVDARGDFAPWLNAVATLRDRLVISEDETYYLAAILSEPALHGPELDAELQRIGEQMDAIEAANGLAEGESYDLDDAPANWRDLESAWEARADQVLADHMRKAGLADVGQTLIDARTKFQERAGKGERRLFPGDDDIVED
jgi:hypothetical protein